MQFAYNVLYIVDNFSSIQLIGVHCRCFVSTTVDSKMLSIIKDSTVTPQIGRILLRISVDVSQFTIQNILCGLCFMWSHKTQNIMTASKHA